MSPLSMYMPSQNCSNPSVKTTRSGESAALTVAIAEMRLLLSSPETKPNEYAYRGRTLDSSDHITIEGIMFCRSWS